MIETPIPDLDPLIHEQTRLAILGALAANTRLTFAELRAHLKSNDGNVSAHARKLEAAGYVTCRKTFAGRVPRTTYTLTAAGRRAFDAYLVAMTALVREYR